MAIKRHFAVTLGKMLQPEQRDPNESEEPYLRSANVQWSGVDCSDLKTMFFSPVEKRELLLCPGDLVVNEGGDVGRCAIWNGEVGQCFFQNSVNRVRPIRGASARLLYYWLQNLKSAGLVDAVVGRTTIAHLTAEKLESLPWADVPPLEQERIAAYLDASCAAIDAAMAAKRKQIATLEAVLHSTYFVSVTRGIGRHDQFWDPQHPLLRVLPVGWGFVALKRLVSTKITDGPHETPELVDDGVQFISAEAIKNNRIDFSLRRGFITPELHAQYSRKCLPRRKDIFIIKSGATTGNVACVDVDFEFSIWSPLALVRCDERKMHYRFAFYVLLTDVFRKQVELSWSFGTQQNIGMRVIERIKVPVPPLNEQHMIADFLDDESSRVARLRAIIENQIATLAAYRKSLIHECVTGQRRVTEADVRRAQAHG